MKKLFKTICASLAEGRFVPRFGWWLLRRKRMKPFLDRAVDRLPAPDRNKIVFHSFSGRIDCNPKYVAREWHRRHPAADVVWILDSFSYGILRRNLPPGVRAVCLGTYRAFREIATAGVVVENACRLICLGMPKKRAGQCWVTTWHGSLGIKRLDTVRSEESQQGERAARDFDAILSNSDFENGVFKGWIFRKTPIVKIGHPRNDVFFLPEAEKAAIRARVRKALGLAEDVHLALYAPTFRAEGFLLSAGRCDVAAWERALADRFGGRWTVAVRLHPTDRRGMRDGLFRLPEAILDASDYEDMQELLVAAEAGVTDYSSWIFDYLLGGAPGFVYAPDRAQYAAGRGLYYPLEETPFPIAEDEAGLCANIRAFDAERYAKDRDRFLAARGCCERGDAAARAVDALERLDAVKKGAK